MKACVLGGGPSGIFVSEYLTKYGVNVDLYEKSNGLLGNYKYARDKADILKNFNAKVHLNADEASIDDSKCDFYVIATGGKEKDLEIEGNEHVIKAMSVIKNCYDSNNPTPIPLLNKNQADICIVGMGNVALDLAYYLKDKVKSITILGRSGLGAASFDNHVMREIINTKKFEVNVFGEIGEIHDKKAQKRYEMLKEKPGLFNSLMKLLFNKERPHLNLIFNSNPQKIKKSNDKFEIEYSCNNSIKKSVFDAVISSIGFIPNVPQIKTRKSIYYTGWCAYPRGNIGDAMVNAKITVNSIMANEKTMKKY